MTEYRVVQNSEELNKTFQVRYEVFVDEQKVPVEMEQDEFDKSAVHVLARENGTVVGTGRLVVENGRGKVGRLAVKKEERGKGIGEGLMKLLEREAKSHNLSEIYLHAQTHAQGFYDKLGYLPRGERFDEAGIEHIEMFKKLS